MALAVYYPVSGFDFVALDDDGYIYQNQQVQQGITPEGLVWAFKTLEMANWHPVTWFSYMLDVSLFGADPGVFHLVNVAFHLANTLLLFGMLRITTQNVWRSAFVAALFALHPLHVESVAWISERKDVLSTFFWMLSTLAYIHYTRSPGITRFCAVLIFFVLGLMAKPMLVTLPLVLLLLDFWPLARDRQDSCARNQGAQPMPWRFLFLEKVPLFILAFISGLITLVAQRGYGAVQSMDMLPLYTRIANALVSYVGYLTKMVWPHSLAALYPYPDNISTARVLAAAFFILVVSTLAARLGKNRPYIFFGWLWYLITLLPVIGLIQVGAQAMADRYTYIPLIGIFIIIAWGIPDLLAKWRPRRAVLPIIAAILVVALAFAARQQTQCWRNSIALFKHALSVNADNYSAHNALALVYEKRGQANKAIAHYRSAIRIRPGFGAAHHNLGNVYLKLGQTDAAIGHYKRALKGNPADIETLNNCAKALVEAGRIPEALENYHRAVALAPQDLGLKSNLGAALILNGQLGAAARRYHDILKLAPDHAGANNNLGYIYEHLGKLAPAARHYDRALQANPGHTQALRGRRRVRGKLKQEGASLPGGVSRDP